jgi:hypothetical protein
MEVEVEPYRAVLDNAMSVVELQGMFFVMRIIGSNAIIENICFYTCL